MKNQPVLGVIGGSGLYSMSALKNPETVHISTPFGEPSAPIIIGTLGNKRVAFLARHGVGHSISPTEVNYRANIFAMKLLGVQYLVSISACGSLREDYAPGNIVIPDNLFDFTKSRTRSFYGEGLVVHIGAADPYCPVTSNLVYQSVVQTGATVHKGGTLITIEGPRFSTRAESNVFRSWGMAVIGMTACPEAFLAREAEICYTTMAHVTDYDVWHITEAAVSVEMVIRTLQQNTAVAQKAIELIAENLDNTHHCDSILAGAVMTSPERVPPTQKSKLDILIGKYISS